MPAAVIRRHWKCHSRKLRHHWGRNFHWLHCRVSRKSWILLDHWQCPWGTTRQGQLATTFCSRTTTESSCSWWCKSRLRCGTESRRKLFFLIVPMVEWRSTWTFIPTFSRKRQQRDAFLKKLRSPLASVTTSYAYFGHSPRNQFQSPDWLDCGANLIRGTRYRESFPWNLTSVSWTVLFRPAKHFQPCCRHGFQSQDNFSALMANV